LLREMQAIGVPTAEEGEPTTLAELADVSRYAS
jgi:hypothetical protein